MACEKRTQPPLALTDPSVLPAKQLKFPLNILPPVARPFAELMRIEKPAGGILVFWPYAWGLTMAAFATHVSLHAYTTLLGKFLFGAFLVRSSACCINDIMDREIDTAVARTKNRPLASGRISVHAAVTLYIALNVLGVLFFSTFNRNAFILGVTQLIPMSFVYPLLKRFTHWPQAWLGIVANFGIVIAYAAVMTDMASPGWMCMFAGCCCWTMLYDTVYACQDRKDDEKAGVGSTAVLFGDYVSHLLIGCGIGFVALLAVAGWANQQGPIYFGIAVLGAAIHLIWQLVTVDLDVPKACWLNFQRNGQLGWIVWFGLVLDYLYQTHYNA